MLSHVVLDLTHSPITHTAALRLRITLEAKQYSLLTSSDVFDAVQTFQRRYNECVNSVDQLRLEV